MKKSLPKIIVFAIIFCLGIGLGILIEKKSLENKNDFASDIATKTVDKLKLVENTDNIEDKKNALKDAYSEIEKITKQEIKIQEEIMKLESEINNEMNLDYLVDDSIDDSIDDSEENVDMNEDNLVDNAEEVTEEN